MTGQDPRTEVRPMRDELSETMAMMRSGLWPDAAGLELLLDRIELRRADR
ncbi:hypothetical protein [Salipiger sp.]